jgi:biotin carboxylase
LSAHSATAAHLRPEAYRSRLAKAEGVPLLEGSELLADSGEACRAAEAVGYPVMLKSTAGGGGSACASVATPVS